MQTSVRALRPYGLDLRAHLTRPGGEHPVVIVHGIGASHGYSALFQRAVAASRPSVSLDLPGFGGTAKPPAPLSVEGYARVIASALDRLGVTGATVFGHSMGAQFATELALIRPELVGELVVAGPVVDPERRSGVRQALALLRDISREPPAVNLPQTAAYLQCGPVWFLRELGPMLRYRIEEAAAGVRQPVLVMRGENDPIARLDWCRRLTASYPDARLVEVAGARHVLQQARPEVVAEHVLRFSAGIAPAAGASS